MKVVVSKPPSTLTARPAIVFQYYCYFTNQHLHSAANPRSFKVFTVVPEFPCVPYELTKVAGGGREIDSEAPFGLHSPPISSRPS